MSQRDRLLAGSGACLALLCASAALARAPELPRELRGRLALEIARCRPVGRGDGLLEAEVVLRTKASAVTLPGLHCAAYDDAGAPFYLAPVTGRLALRERETHKLTVRFAADATHRQCGCTVRVLAPPRESDEPALSSLEPRREARGAPPSGGASDPPRLAAQPEEAAPTAAGNEQEVPGAAFAAPALRYERVLAPELALRAEPIARAAITGVAPAGARIAVDRIERGWKLARTADGLAGWLPSDAATADIAAPERMSERLAPLHHALAPGASRSEALCASLERSALSELVAAWRVHERAVYVYPLWYALAHEDRDAFRTWAADCYSTTRVMDVMTGRQIQGQEREAAR